MKNIKQLKKEIEEKNKEHREEAKRLRIEPLSDNGWDDTIELEAKLQTLKQVCEEIENVEKRKIDNYYAEDGLCKCKLNQDFSDDAGKENPWWINLEDFRNWIDELLKKFQGEEQ